MADTKPTPTPATPATPAASTSTPPKSGAKEAETVTKKEPLKSNHEVKTEKITKLLERLTDAQLDSVLQYVDNQANPTPR